MKYVRNITDLNECRELWKRLIPKDQISDLWEVRDCFQRHYNHRPNFVTANDNNGVCGFLPLSWNEETKTYLYFPGETWEGKTWLEQNHLIFRDGATLKSLLNCIPEHYYLRYLQPTEEMINSHHTIDEIGYYFLPPRYDYDINNYLTEFSGKSRKRLRRELDVFGSRDHEFVYNNESDFETMVSLNFKRYGALSYFSDSRFL